MSDERNEPWLTAITQIEPNHVRVRGYDIAEIMGTVSFGTMVHLILRGELPDEKVGRLMDAILCAAIDHGATPPSVLAARTVASTGATLSASVAAGIMAINDYHGGAIGECATQLRHIVRRCGDSGQTVDCVATALLEELRAQGRRVSGFGHRVHSDDPRTRRLFELAEEAGVSGPHVDAARAIERVFREAGKDLPLNVDGAMAAVLADLDYEPSVMNGLFMIARSAGLVAHVHEEQTRMKPMRRIDPFHHQYDGPAARSR
jgi:citrate synthase